MKYWNSWIAKYKVQYIINYYNSNDETIFINIEQTNASLSYKRRKGKKPVQI